MHTSVTLRSDLLLLKSHSSYSSSSSPFTHNPIITYSSLQSDSQFFNCFTSSIKVATMSSSFSDSFSTYFNTTIELSNCTTEQSRFVYVYDSEIFTTYESHPIDIFPDSLHAAVHLHLLNPDVEPTPGAVFQCSGQILDLGDVDGIKYTVQSYNKYDTYCNYFLLLLSDNLST